MTMADQELRQAFTKLRDWVMQEIRAAIPFVRDGKLDLSSNNIVGSLPATHGGSGTNTGAEPALGNPASDGQVLSSTTAGVRSWIDPAGAAALADLTDVTITTPADDQVLTYDSATSTWVNETPASALANPMTTADDVIIGGTSGTPTRLPKGSNNTVFGVDGSGVLGYKADPTGAGGGATSGSGTEASRPAAGNAGNLYLPTDAPVLFRDAGSAWQSFGPLLPLTRPDAAAYTWVNQQGATAMDSHGGLLLDSVNTTGGMRLLVVTPASAPYGFELAFVGMLPTSNFCHCGICGYDAVSGKLLTWGLEYSSGLQMRVKRRTSVTVNSSNPFSAGIGALDARRIWKLRLYNDGVNWLCQISDDLVNWYTVYSEALTAFVTPDHTGFYVDPAGTSAVQLQAYHARLV